VCKAIAKSSPKNNTKQNTDLICEFVAVYVHQVTDIRGTLASTAKGVKVLAEYDRHQTLSSESRQTLVKITVAQLVDECG